MRSGRGRSGNLDELVDAQEIEEPFTEARSDAPLARPWPAQAKELPGHVAEVMTAGPDLVEERVEARVEAAPPTARVHARARVRPSIFSVTPVRLFRDEPPIERRGAPERPGNRLDVFRPNPVRGEECP